MQYLLDCTLPTTKLNQSFSPIALKGCFGGWPATAFSYILENGLMFESDYPYAGAVKSSCPSSAQGRFYPLVTYYVLQPLSVPTIMEAVAVHGSVTAIIQILSDFNGYEGGIYNNSACTGDILSHAVTIVGYGVDSYSGAEYWYVKNSFGREWGIGGYLMMLKGVNMCGIEANTALAIVNGTTPSPSVRPSRVPVLFI